MSTEEVRAVAGTAIRDLNHAFAAHDPDDERLRELVATVEGQVARLSDAPPRDRMALMRAAPTIDGFPAMTGTGGFADRAVGGGANPTGVDIDVRVGPDEVVANVVLRRAFEGAPGRAHGGIVAAAFDDVTGYVIGMLREPAFTGELTVRYLAPVPVDEPIEMRSRLEGRERRKLFITAEARHDGRVIATCHAIYITVDPARFAGAPDPR